MWAEIGVCASIQEAIVKNSSVASSNLGPHDLRSISGDVQFNISHLIDYL